LEHSYYLSITISPSTHNTYQLRNAASHILSRACDDDKDTIFAILSVGRKLFTMIQPSNPQHQLCHSDLIMLLNFVGSHDNNDTDTNNNNNNNNNTTGTGTGGGTERSPTSRELWLPVCLPRLDPSCFVYAYHHSCHMLHDHDHDDGTSNGNGNRSRRRLDITLISQQRSTERFASLRRTAHTIKKELGMDVGEDDSVLRIYDLRRRSSPKEPVPASSRRDEDVDLLWERTGGSRTRTRNDARRNSNSNSNSASSLPKITGSLPDGRTGHTRLPPITRHRSIIASVISALQPNNYRTITSSYLQTSPALHFILSHDLPILHHRTREPTGGTSTQSLTSPLLPPFHHPTPRRRLWTTYQKLTLRLRLPSASVRTTINAIHRTADHNDRTGHYPASHLHETPPPTHEMEAYARYGDVACCAVCGDGYRLYAAFGKGVGVVEATGECRRLVGALMEDRGVLFLKEPLAF